MTHEHSHIEDATLCPNCDDGCQVGNYCGGCGQMVCFGCYREHNSDAPCHLGAEAEETYDAAWGEGSRVAYCAECDALPCMCEDISRRVNAYIARKAEAQPSHTAGAEAGAEAGADSWAYAFQVDLDSLYAYMVTAEHAVAGLRDALEDMQTHVNELHERDQ